MGHNLARRLCAWRHMPRPCLPPSGPRPAFRLNPFLFLAREQHDSAHPPLAQHPQLFAGLGDKIFEMSRQDLEPSPTSVSLDSGFQVASAFNAIRGATSPVSVPGSPPFWKTPKLPWHLPETARETAQPGLTDSNQLRMLDLSLKIEHPGFRYDGVDIVTHVSVLLRLLLFCKKTSGPGACRFSLRMTQDTLRIGHDPSIMSTRVVNPSGALRSAVIKHCAEPAPGLEHSTHYRSVQYQLGHVSCVVQSEVGVLRKPRRAPRPSPDTVKSVVGSKSDPRVEPALVRIHHQGDQLCIRRKGPRISLHWFSRIPVALVPRFTGKGDTVTRISEYHLTEVAREWEKNEVVQVALRKLATLLSELKKAVKAAAPDGQECIGIIDKSLGVPTIRLYFAEGESKVAPEGESEVAPEGESKVAPEGESKVALEGESKLASEGESKVVSEGESKVAPEGESKVAPEGESKVAPEGESKVALEGEPKVAPEGEPKVAPEDIGSKPELGETSRGQDEALGGGGPGPGPTTPA